MKTISNWMMAAVVVTLVPMSAFAGEGRKEGPEKMKFPMAATEYRAKISERQAKHKERLDKILAEKNIPADKAKEIRERIAQKEAKVNAKVNEVTKDGTVTEDEAKAVREVAREGRPGRGEGKRGGPRAK